MRRFAAVMIMALMFSSLVQAGEGKEKAGQLEEVVIKGESRQELTGERPILQFDTDPFASIQESLKPPESLLLAEHEAAFAARGKNPLLLRSARVIAPWRRIAPVSLIFKPQDKLSEVLGRPVPSKEAKSFSWALTIADQEGKAFHALAGSNPPEKVEWNGQNASKEWMVPGLAYSAVYVFTGADGKQYTTMGKAVRLEGFVHSQGRGAVIRLDAAVLFSARREDSRLNEPEGERLLGAAVDYLKRYHAGSPLAVRVHGQGPALSALRGQAVRDFMAAELMLPASAIAVQNLPSSTALVEITAAVQ